MGSARVRVVAVGLVTGGFLGSGLSASMQDSALANVAAPPSAASAAPSGTASAAPSTASAAPSATASAPRPDRQRGPVHGQRGAVRDQRGAVRDQRGASGPARRQPVRTPRRRRGRGRIR